MTQDTIPYGKICSVEELGRLARAHRKERQVGQLWRSPA